MPLNIDDSSRPDMARQVEAEKQLERSLVAGKEVWLEELGRVRNNLEIMISLLELQAGTIRDQQAREAFKVSRDRLKAMAFAYEGLYHSRGRSEVNLADCICRLVKHLFSSYDARRNIELAVDVERILLDIDQAIPCALIINELVSNALKHAFPSLSPSAACCEKEGGYQVRVEMHAQDGHYTLAVGDNGVGFPAEVDFTPSLGMRLVTMLAMQLGGAIQLDRSGGTFRSTSG